MLFDRQPGGAVLTEDALTAQFPRLRFAQLPTPLEEAPRLGAALGGVRVLIKRDDLTGLALGGNKARKLEWLVGEAKARGADCVITLGAGQSNHCRQTAAAAARAGLDCYLILSLPFHGEGQGNLLLDDLLGATIVRVESGDAVERATDDLLKRLRAEGRQPYLIPVGGSNPVGALGYVLCALELHDQLARLGATPSHVFVASGSAGTQGGLLVGARAAGDGYRIVGISPGSKAADVISRVLAVANATAEKIGLPDRFGLSDVLVDDAYTGPAYGTLTAECSAAIRLLARTEGILLDPVYAGKAMAGLIDYVRRGVIPRDSTVVFIHTGGTPALFAYAAELRGAH
jgi:D-cysteine desulfhydrase family pyridoxal phosphate-dependent enzyme